MSTIRSVEIDVGIREYDLPDDVDLPGSLDIEAHIDVLTTSDSVWEDVPELATYLEVAFEDAAARKLRDLGYVRDDEGGDD